MNPRRSSDYARVLRAHLPPDLFAPVPGRLGWLALHGGMVTVSIAAIATGAVGWLGAALLSPVIGHGFACLAFVAHETLHGAVVRDPRARHVIGWVAFLPFALSPRLWVVWHNQVHHGHTMKPGVDPDSYPTLEEWRASRAIRLIERASLGRGNWAGALSVLIGFPVQSLQMLVRLGGDRRYFTRREQLLTVGETVAGVALWAGLAAAIGPLRFLFAFALPLLVGGTVIMSYILTNHSLSPLTEVNDPLLNSLTVTTPRIVELLHLQFGLHVEHHLFPAMSATRAHEERRLLLRLWPERYQSMPLARALGRLARTCRIYRGPTTLVEPTTGREWPTLLPLS
jgi:fatty acid desaturase